MAAHAPKGPDAVYACFWAAAALPFIRTPLFIAQSLVDRVIHVRTLHVGPDELLVGAKIAISKSDTGAEIAAGIDDAEARLRAAVPSAVYVFLEPDLDRTARSAD